MIEKPSRKPLAYGLLPAILEAFDKGDLETGESLIAAYEEAKELEGSPLQEIKDRLDDVRWQLGYTGCFGTKK